MKMMLKKILADILYVIAVGYSIRDDNIVYVTLNHNIHIYKDYISIRDAKSKFSVLYIYENNKYIFHSIEYGTDLFRIYEESYIADVETELTKNDYLIWLSREYLCIK